MKKVIKIVLIIAGFIFLLGACAAMMGVEDTTEPQKEPQAQETQAEAPKQPEAEKPQEKKPEGVTMAQFTQLENGMSYEEVVAVIGEGEIMSETGEKGDQFYTVMYSWEGSGDLGANMTAMFQGNKLQSKAQMGLK